MVELTNEQYEQIKKVLPQVESKTDLVQNYDLEAVINFIGFFKAEPRNKVKIEKPESAGQMALA